MAGTRVGQLVKPPLWVPGRNPDAADLWWGCIGYWPLWEGGGNRCFDISGYAHHGTPQNLEAADFGAGVHGRHISFGGSGTSELVSYPAGTVGTPAEMAVMVYVKLRSAGERDGVIDSSDGAKGFCIRVSHTDASKWDWFCYRSGGLSLAHDVGALTTGTWYVMHGVMYADRVELFIDGLSVGTNADAVGTLVQGAVLKMASGYEAGESDCACDVALAVIWDRALQPGEVAALAADPFLMIRPPEALG